MKSLIEQLKIDEGFSKIPYLCPAGRLTIGYGYNLQANPLHISDVTIKAWKSHGIYEHEAKHILERMINDCIMVCENNFVWWSKLSKARQYAIVNMVYNLGMSRFLGFKQMIRCLARRLGYSQCPGS
jgi:lysozyme